MFNTLLKQAMSDADMNLTALSAATGIGKSSISQYLSGKNEPTDKRKVIIAQALGLAPDFFKTSEVRIYNMMKYPDANTLVVRKTFRTLKDSCFTDLMWAAKRLNVSQYWKFTESPLEAEYIPTGQKIYFRGLDDPLKITSITVAVGCLCWMWLEEAYEITKESDFDTLDETIRGEVPDGLFKQVTITFNPWNEKIWLKKRFFDKPDPDVLAITTNYTCNEWLDAADKRLFERMKVNNPRRYKVAGLGEWGISEGLVC